MIVLIVTKTTNYELHGAVVEAKVASGRVSQDALTRLKTAHAEHYETMARLRGALQKAGISAREVSRDEELHRGVVYDCVITVGGDGTLLAASHDMDKGGTIFGVRSSLSSVGYLCCAGPGDIDLLVKALVNGDYEVTVVERLVAEILRADTGEVFTTKPILNDFLYTNANPAATTRYRLTYKDTSEVQRSSGLWIATGTGSTAAIYAAGGDRRRITDHDYQFKVRELYRLGAQPPFSPSLDRGFFDPDRDQFEIENRCQSATLAMDGQHGGVELAYGDTVRFKRAVPIGLVTKVGSVRTPARSGEPGAQKDSP